MLSVSQQVGLETRLVSVQLTATGVGDATEGTTDIEDIEVLVAAEEVTDRFLPPAPRPADGRGSRKLEITQKRIVQQ
jgi:hypothetical protein